MECADRAVGGNFKYLKLIPVPRVAAESVIVQAESQIATDCCLDPDFRRDER